MEAGTGLKLLVSEIDTQLYVLSCKEDCTLTPPTNKVVISLSEEGDGYYQELQKFRASILTSLARLETSTALLAIESFTEHRVSDILAELEHNLLLTGTVNCFWKIPTFKSPSSLFIEPEIMNQQETRLCVVRRHGNSNNHTTDIWSKEVLQVWANQQSSMIIAVQGSSQSTDRLRHFSCEIVNHLLGQNHATVYILNHADVKEHFRKFGTNELLRQIASQLLRLITADVRTLFLAEILSLSKHASTAQEWFPILELLVQKLASIFVVIDVSVLQGQANVADLWVEEFNDIFRRSANESNVCAKVMILSNRKMEIASKDCLYAEIGPGTDSAPLGETSRLAQIRRASIPKLAFFIPSNITKKQNTAQKRSSQNSTCADSVAEGLEQRLNCQEMTEEDSKLSSSTIVKGPNDGKLIFPFESNQILPNELGMLDVKSPRQYSADGSSKTFQQRQEISVAIICALSLEADAVEVLCDETYELHGFEQAAADSNQYTVAQLGRHKVVILYLPAMGKSNAATSATNCLHSFPNIRLALLTGICGGIPSPYTNAEIHLGDVIVSDRLVLYDFGRRFPEGFARKDTISDNARKPPRGIAAFLSKLKTRVGSDRLSTRMVNHLNWLRTESQHGEWATYPGISNDVSFEATYHHKHQNGECGECSASTRSACAAAREAHCAILGCDGQRTITRKRHKDTLHHPKEIRLVEPVVHFGAYASGDIVMKSGEDRDEIGRREKVIAFEMEGAGVWDNVPTIIVKGVCDYADSHKNKDWQKYAATTAASCVKALLEEWST